MRDAAQLRLAGLAENVLDDLAVGRAGTDVQATGDRLNAFLPREVEVHLALPALLRSWRDRLAQDNDRYRDRIRLRLSAAIGPVAASAMGFGGGTIVELSRLLDSAVLRRAVVDNPASDLTVLVSDQLYAYVIGEGHPRLDAAEFRRRKVVRKEYTGFAWLLAGGVSQVGG